MIEPLPLDKMKRHWHGKKVRVCKHDGSSLRMSSGMKHGEVLEGIVTIVCTLRGWEVNQKMHAEQNFLIPEECALLRVHTPGSSRGANFYGWELVIIPDTDAP